MNQIIHIFRKDVRHHWIELLLCQAALAAYSWNAVSGWRTQGSFNGILHGGSLWSRWTVLVALLPLTWWFLIFRVVQSESLVGDRQFWITRPYEWKKLLVAKVLFVSVFINAPLLLAGVVLLIKAGFAPGPHLLGLLWMQLLLIQLPLLPMAALAAVTRNITQGFLALLALVLYIAGMGALDSDLVQSSLTSFDDLNWLRGAVLVIASLVAIGLQYALRKTGQARIWLAGAAATITLIAITTAYFAHGGERQYPLPPAGRQPVMQTALYPEKPSPAKYIPDKDDDPEIDIMIPIVVRGLPTDSLAHVKGIRLTVEAPDGFRWRSSWQWSIPSLLEPRETNWRQGFTMDRKTFERLKSIPVKVRISMALEIFRERNVRQIETTHGEFAVPNVGICQIKGGYYENYIQCRSPLLKPSMFVVRTDPAASTCPAPNDVAEKQSSPVGIPYAWEWESVSGPAKYGVSPVESFPLFFFVFNKTSRANVCPGTPLNVNFPEFVERTRAEFEVSDFKVDEYRRENWILSDRMKARAK